MNYTLKIGERCLKWVDNCWYETSNERSLFYKTLYDVQKSIKLLAKHYVYHPTVLELDENGNEREITLFKKEKFDSYLNSDKKGTYKILCKF